VICVTFVRLLVVYLKGIFFLVKYLSLIFCLMLMEVYYNESHYHIHINKWDENIPLLQGRSLEAKLKQDSSFRELGKRFRFSLNFGVKNASVKYVPENSSFEELKEINLIIGREEYHWLFERGSYVIRDGTKSFDLHLEESLEGFE
jgi:hypothetical protein